MQDICSKNMAFGHAMHKNINDASYLKDDTKTETGENGTEMAFDSSFLGAAHIGARTEEAAISEDYFGRFHVSQVIKICHATSTSNTSNASDLLPCP